MIGRKHAQTQKPLVVYYSLSGNTARVARDLAARMGADLESIRDSQHGTGVFGYLKDVIDAVRCVAAKIDEPERSAADYALTIMGTPVWAGHMTPAVRAYLQKSAGQLGDVAFFVTSGDTDAVKIVPALESVGQCKAVAFTGFNARDLADRSTYESRITAFLHAIGNARHASPDADADAHEPAHAR